jgi:hypothetical protein
MLWRHDLLTVLQKILLQIITLQSFHYLLMALLLPPLLSTYTLPILLDYSGGPKTVSYVLDWREMSARSTAPRSWLKPYGENGALEPWLYGIDDRRGWIIALAWMSVSLVE